MREPKLKRTQEGYLGVASRRGIYGGGVIQPSLTANFLSSPSFALSVGNISLTRATAATEIDQDTVLRSALSGEARFQGMRRVENLCPTPSATISVAGNKTITASIGTYVFSMGAEATGTALITFTGTATGSTGTLTANATNRTAKTLTITAAGTIIATCTVAAANNIQFENVTGQTNQNPGEYVSVGVLSSPFHGVGVDGVKYFLTLNGNTVASNVVTEATGASIATGGKFANCVGVFGNSFSTPDSSANSITGDIDIRCYAAAADWTPGANGTLVAKTDSYSFQSAAGGPLAFWYSSTTGAFDTFKNSTVAISFADLTAGWVRVTRSASTGDIKFYTSLDSSTWTQLGTTVTSAISGIADSGNVLAIGSQGFREFLGRCYRAQLYSTIDGTTAVVDFNPNSYTTGTTWTSVTGEVWTINGNASVISPPNQGLLVEPAATDLLTARADARDMTTANWTLGATMTRARTSVGYDGTANTATRLTGGAVAATNTILTTITAAASSRTYSVAIKRVTGTGAVSICQDGATFTDISSLLNTSTYTVVSLTASQLNAQLGIKISTLNDAIDADWNQFEAVAATSRVPTAISTRNADVASIATGSWYSAAAGTLFVQFIQPVSDSNTHSIVAFDDGTANNRIRIATSAGTTTCLITVGGVDKFSATIASPTAGTTVKIAFAWAVNDGNAWQNNVAMTIGTAGTTLPTVTTTQIGNSASANQLNAAIGTIKYYNTRLPDATAKALTA